MRERDCLKANTFFNDSLIGDRNSKKFSFKWLSFPFSLIIHLAVLTSLIVIPVLSVSDYPELKVSGVYISKVPVTPGVPPQRPNSNSRQNQGGKNKDELMKNSNIAVNRFIAPLEPPQNIAQVDELPDFSLPTGQYDSIGVEGGDPEATIEQQQLWSKELKNIESAEKNYYVPVRQAKKIKEVAPAYPELARKLRVQGDVVIEAVTDVYGRVSSVRIISGNPLLVDAAREAAMQWLFEPYLINGIPKPVKLLITLSFRLEN